MEITVVVVGEGGVLGDRTVSSQQYNTERFFLSL